MRKMFPVECADVWNEVCKNIRSCLHHISLSQAFENHTRPVLHILYWQMYLMIRILCLPSIGMCMVLVKYFVLIVLRWSGLQLSCCYSGEVGQRGEAAVSHADIFNRVRGQSRCLSCS